MLTQKDVNNEETFTPYLVPSMPFTLWGRDVLSQMGVLLYSPDEKVTSQMLQMRYDPLKGLGKNGIEEPIETIKNVDRQGIGYKEQEQNL